MIKQRHATSVSIKPGWPPPAFFQTPANLLQGQEPNLLAHFQPTPRPFYLFGSAAIPVGVVTRMHSHPIISLHSCLQGPLTLLTPAGEQVLDAGTFYMIAPGIRHHWRNDGCHTAVSMGFLIDVHHTGAWPAASGLRECCRELHRLVRGLHRLSVVGDSELQQTFWALADHLVTERPRPCITTVGLICTLLGLVVERLGQSSEATAAQTDVAQQIRRFLLTHVDEQLSIGEVAREVGMSPTRAKQAFHRTYGCGIISYFNQLKIWQAKRLLCDPTLTVDQVSRKLGFSSSSYFNRVFHRFTGESPTDYRNQNQHQPRMTRIPRIKTD
jgi:AraC-like DNA-binding protein